MSHLIWHLLISCLTFRRCIRSSHFLCPEWDSCVCSYFRISWPFSRYFYYLVLPPSRSQPSDVIILLRAFLHTLLFAARRLFSRCTLISHDKVPKSRLQSIYFILQEADHVPYVPRCRPVLFMLREACSFISWILRGGSLHNPHPDIEISCCYQDDVCCLPYEAFIPFFSKLTLLLWPNVLPSFVARGSQSRCLVIVKPILIDPFALRIRCASRRSGYLHSTS